MRSIKRQIDGALGAHGALLLAPYQDLPGSTGVTGRHRALRAALRRVEEELPDAYQSQA